MFSLSDQKIGIIGVGNMGKAAIKALVESGRVKPENIYVTNRSPGRIEKIKKKFNVNVISGNDELVNQSDIVIICVKPQDLEEALAPCRNTFTNDHVVISLAAGVEINQLRRMISEANLCRIMMNTPIFIRKGVIGYCCQNSAYEELIEDIFSSMGTVIKLEEGDQFEAFTVASSSGTGFIFEIMSYWQEWIEEHGIEPEVARKIVVQTFLGTSQLAEESTEKIEDLQNRVTSKKGVTAAGLESMRSLEVEGLLRMSFNKAALRSRDLGRKE